METKKVTLITGVSRETGLGLETARQMTKIGYKVVISARKKESLDESLAILQNEKLDAIGLILDITNDDSIKNAYEEINSKLGRLDSLINNAGGYYDVNNDPLTVDFNFIMAAFNTNLFGAWKMIQTFTPLLEKNANSCIVNVSSGAGSYKDENFGLFKNQQAVPVYGITKLALNGLTVKCSISLKSKGILVNSVCPGFVATYPGTKEWGARPVEDGAKGIVWAATLPSDGPTGGFFRDGKIIEW